MKHLKTFEATQEEIERIHSEIKNKYVMHFNSSEDFDDNGDFNMNYERKDVLTNVEIDQRVKNLIEINKYNL